MPDDLSACKLSKIRISFSYIERVMIYFKSDLIFEVQSTDSCFNYLITDNNEKVCTKARSYLFLSMQYKRIC